MDAFASIECTPAENDFFDKNSGPRKFTPEGQSVHIRKRRCLACAAGSPRVVSIQLFWPISWGHLTTLVAMIKAGALDLSQCCYLMHMDLEWNLGSHPVLTMWEPNGSFRLACHMVRLSEKLMILLNIMDCIRWHAPGSRGSYWWWSGVGKWQQVFVHGRSCWSLMPRGSRRSFELDKYKSD